MDNFDLNFSKEEFKKFYEKNDYINALKVAESIIENAPESVYGWYYVSVIKTENFTKNFDDAETRKYIDKFYEIAPYEVSEKYKKFERDAKKVKRLKESGLEEQPAKEKKQKVKKPCRIFSVFKKPFVIAVSVLCLIFCVAVYIPAIKSDSVNPVTYYQTDSYNKQGGTFLYDAFIVYLKFNEKDGRAKPLRSVWINFGKKDAEDNDRKTFIISVAQSEKASYFTSETNGGGEFTIYDTYEKANTFYKLYDLDNASAEYCFLQFFFKESEVINEIVFIDTDGEKIPAEITCAGPNAHPLSIPDATMYSSQYAYKTANAKKVLDESNKFSVKKINGEVYNEKTDLTVSEKNALSVTYKIRSGDGKSDIKSSSLTMQLISLGTLIFGGGSFGVRFISSVAAIIGAVIVYLTIRKLLSKEIFALISSFIFLAVNFLLLTLETPVVLPMIISFFAISVYFMYGFFAGEEDKKKDIKNLSLSGLFSSFAVASSVYSLIGTALISTLFAFGVRNRLKNKTFTVKVKNALLVNLLTFLLSFAVLAAALSLICYFIPRI